MLYPPHSSAFLSRDWLGTLHLPELPASSATAHLPAADGVDAADVPVGPGQHQLGDRPPTAAVGRHEPAAEEPAGRARTAQPVCRRHDGAWGHDTVRREVYRHRAYSLGRASWWREKGRLTILETLMVRVIYIALESILQPVKSCVVYLDTVPVPVPWVFVIDRWPLSWSYRHHWVHFNGESPRPTFSGGVVPQRNSVWDCSL